MNVELNTTVMILIIIGYAATIAAAIMIGRISEAIKHQKKQLSRPTLNLEEVYKVSIDTTHKGKAIYSRFVITKDSVKYSHNKKELFAIEFGTAMKGVLQKEEEIDGNNKADAYLQVIKQQAQARERQKELLKKTKVKL